MQLVKAPWQSIVQLNTLKPSTVLKEQDLAQAAIAIGEQLKKIAKLYQVPNWDDTNTVLLTDWIIETYGFESIETITKALTRPFIQKTSPEKRTYRLTPDVISEWMEYEIEQESLKREKAIHNLKHQDKENWDEEALRKWKEIIDAAPGLKPAPKLSDKEIYEEGQDKPKKPLIKYTSREYVITKAIHLEWVKANHDPYTGHPLPNYMSEEEWTLLNF